MIKCNRCDGKGRLEEFKHVDRGICYKCHGLGVVEKESIIKNTQEEATIYDLFKVTPSGGVIFIQFFVFKNYGHFCGWEIKNNKKYSNIKQECIGLEELRAEWKKFKAAQFKECSDRDYEEVVSPCHECYEMSVKY